MLNRVYRLVEAHTIEPVSEYVEPSGDTVAVRPTHLSICNADQRYYQGKRSARVMAKKLPMALSHEGIGRVVFDPAGEFEPGTRVVMLPGYDGFMQELCILPHRRVLALPEGIDLHVAAFTELVSVAVHAVTRFGNIAHARKDTIGVWGDGNLGFIVSLVLHLVYPEARIYVVGRNPYKLADFTFAHETFLSSGIPDQMLVDHAFECCGGEGSTSAIEQIIDHIRPEGSVGLMGVSEYPVPVNTRMVLEKGLRVFGSSRSGRADFEKTLQLHRDHPEMAEYLTALIGNVIPVRDIFDIAHAFDVDIQKQMGKTIMEWRL